MAGFVVGACALPGGGPRATLIRASRPRGFLVAKPNATKVLGGSSVVLQTRPVRRRAAPVFVAILCCAALLSARPNPLLVTAADLGATWAGPPASWPSCPTSVEKEVVRLVNLERSNVGLDPVGIDMRLIGAARRHSDDMAANDFVSHTGSDGSSPWDRIADAGYPLLAGGETIGAGYPNEASVVQGWMDSPPHQEILLGSDFQHIGVGYGFEGDSTYGHYWTADFGSSSDEGDPPPTSCDTPPGPFRVYLPLIQR